jgi:branched-chain amino acid transport system permease protein
VLTTLLGGLGTVFGPVMGAVLVTAMENYLAQFGSWVTIIEGAIFVVCVLTFRRGIVGVLGPYLAGPRKTVAAPARVPANRPTEAASGK